MILKPETRCKHNSAVHETNSVRTLPRIYAVWKLRLTSQVVAAPPSLQHFPLICFVPSRHLAHRFVARREQDNGYEGEDERSGAVDVPAIEYDAEISGIPSEQHLSRC